MTLLVQPMARISAQSDVLETIRDESVSLAIWERTSHQALEALLHQNLRDVRLSCACDLLEAWLGEAIDSCGFAATEGRDELAADIVDLAQKFCAVTEFESLDLRLEVVTTNACRKFHGDYVKARLITTYVGEGTQWLEQEDAERLAKGLEPQTVRQLTQGDVGLFKGKLATLQPAIHRSPPLDDTGKKRLLLVLNPAQHI